MVLFRRGRRGWRLPLRRAVRRATRLEGVARRGTSAPRAPSHGPALRSVYVHQLRRPRQHVCGHHPAVGGLRLLSAPAGVCAVVLLSYLYPDAAGRCLVLSPVRRQVSAAVRRDAVERADGADAVPGELPAPQAAAVPHVRGAGGGSGVSQRVTLPIALDPAARAQPLHCALTEKCARRDNGRANFVNVHHPHRLLARRTLHLWVRRVCLDRVMEAPRMRPRRLAVLPVDARARTCWRRLQCATREPVP